ncbi:protein kinase BUB1 ASCRUDRAFT_37092 [Ascoidea rubescens DSM 1968]|uniref:Kinase-like protein n=1 Tax=Ascoidea rubescens DSM 1968 TaxID=1344418 RepID=A0A1D2VDS0_9ASCO|nr:hypothetical protein ASCRUDRAFT_37092 [Ascoidea rubescens DSM 1968]ODV59660.1 hypothetical protein ASCRUDRAFT_37092 [Ascoidea rubescens DSM 1968]
MAQLLNKKDRTTEKPTSFNSIEDEKENIQPILQGRSVAALSNTFKRAKNYDQFHSSIINDKLKFENNLSNADLLDDPIQPYLDYLDWFQQTFPQGPTLNNGYIDFLEKSIRKFQSNSTYKFYHNDPRYLKFWLIYLKYTDNPFLVFKFLYKNKIALNLSLYYEFFANYLESTHSYLNSLKIYLKGIQNNARPIKRLISNYYQFLSRNRFILNTNLNISFQSHDISNIDIDNDIKIINLPETQPPSTNIGLYDHNSTTDQIGILPSINPTINKNKKKISIFTELSSNEENNNNNSHNNTNNNSFLDSLSKNLTNWNDIGTIAQNRKENYISPTSWDALKRPFDQISNDKLDSNPLNKTNEETVSSTPKKLKISNNYHKPQVHTELIGYNDEVQIDKSTLKNKKHQSSGIIKKPQSPTQTIFTKKASEEVLFMFNQKFENNFKTQEKNPKVDIKFDENELGIHITTTTKQPLKSITDDKTSSIFDDKLNSSPFITNPLNFSSKEKIEYLKIEIIDPFNEKFKQEIINNNILPLLNSYKNFYRYSKDESVNMSENFEKAFANANISNIKKSVPLAKSDEIFCIRRKIGEGGYAKVYLSETSKGEFRAIKLEKPANMWEYYILNQIKERFLKISNDKNLCVSNSVINVDSLHYFEDESYLILDYCNQGTILDIINFFKEKSKMNNNQSVNVGISEKLCIFFTIHLLRIVENLHEIGIIHGDLKSDNCLLNFEKLENNELKNWNPKFDRNGEDNWKFKGIKLIDFGRAIDVELYKEKKSGSKKIRFKTSNKRFDNLGGQDCPQLREDEVWSYEIDYFGLASIIYSMLFGEYIKIERIDNNGINRYKLASKFKRYWKTELWEPLFDFLLNCYDEKADDCTLPKTGKLKKFREMFEDWLEINYNDGEVLKNIIWDIETTLSEQNFKKKYS